MSAKYCRRTGKHSHPSVGAAEAHLRSIVKMKPGYSGHVYGCTYCCGWHVGRIQKGAHVNRYRRQG